MDFGAPVAQHVNVSPNQGLSTLSDLMNLKKQQLGIQQEQLKTGQMQGVQDFFNTWNPGDHVASDGSTDLDSALQSPQFKAAGNAKPDIMQKLLDIKQHQLQAKQQLAGLNSGLVTQFGTGMGALADDEDVKSDKTDPTTGVNAGRAKVDQFLTNFSKLSPDAARVAQIYAPITQHAPAGKLARGIQALQLQAQSASEQQAQQNPIPGAIDTGGAYLPTTTPRSTGVPQLTGQAISKQLAPQVISQPGTGAPAVVGGAQGTVPKPVGPPGASLPTNWWNPAPGQSQLLTANTAGLAGRIQQGQQIANTSPQAMDALQRARAILDRGNVATGGWTFSLNKDLRNIVAGLTGAKVDETTDMNELVKNLARYEASRAAAVGNTDAARTLFETGAPNTKVDTEAAKNIVTQAIGTEMAIQGYAKVVGSAQDPQTAQQKEQAFRSVPHLVQAYEYGHMRSSQEADAFLKQYSLSKAQIAASRAALRQLGAL